VTAWDFQSIERNERENDDEGSQSGLLVRDIHELTAGFAVVGQVGKSSSSLKFGIFAPFQISGMVLAGSESSRNHG